VNRIKAVTLCEPDDSFNFEPGMRIARGSDWWRPPSHVVERVDVETGTAIVREATRRERFLWIVSLPYRWVRRLWARLRWSGK